MYDALVKENYDAEVSNPVWQIKYYDRKKTVMSYWGFPRYVSAGEKQQRSKKKLEQLRKKHKNIEPVIIEGRTLAHTWWGKAWNKNWRDTLIIVIE